ncbi:MAG: alpha/beta hydrolase [Lewinellaceae bacterium]|nr:alpha/beta hydrolase [Lewinellaceae bacterium]
MTFLVGAHARAFCFLLLCLGTLSACSSTRKIKTENGISEMSMVSLGGSKQWVLIRGEDLDNPILLFLHGGPGVSETPLLRKYNAELEKHFTMVYWDQRGACKSFNRHIPPQSMTLSQMVADAHELIGLLKARFGKPKIFLMGHSWGTILAIPLLQKCPQDFYAFVGIGQAVNVVEEEQLSYQFTLEKAKELKNKKAVRELEQIGKPQEGRYSPPSNIQKQRKWLLRLGGNRFDKKHFRDHVLALLFSREYTVFDLFKCLRGMKFSSRYLGEDERQVNFLKTAPALDVPVIFINGKDDHVTPTATVKQYFDLLKAPDKQLFIFGQSAHSPLFAEAARFNRLIIELLPKYLNNGQ